MYVMYANMCICRSKGVYPHRKYSKKYSLRDPANNCARISTAVNWNIFTQSTVAFLFTDFLKTHKFHPYKIQRHEEMLPIHLLGHPVCQLLKTVYKITKANNA